MAASESVKETVVYRVSLANPAAHIIEVSCRVRNPVATGQEFSLPAWIPGSYMIRDFSRNILSMQASCNSNPVAIEKLDKQRWRCEPCDDELLIEYQVYAWDLSVRGAHFDSTHAFFNGTSVFLSPAGKETLRCDVLIEPPPGNEYLHWQVATSLPTAGAGLRQFGQYCAENYDELVDHPVEAGDFDVHTFEVAGIPHDLVLTGRQSADIERICRDLQKICEHHVNLFGELPPMERYVFLTMVVGDGYGGLEHRASTALMCSRRDLPLPHETGISTEYRSFLGLCSHEYFHTWNVKRIKPARFTPYDLGREVHTQLLWAFEGITSYYDDLALVRCGLIPKSGYLELLGQNITRYLRTPGRKIQTVTDSSFDAWTRFYKQDENAPNAIVSYYNKGALIACLLDLTIRRRSGGGKSLDDVMRRLWLDYGKQGVGVDETGLEQDIARYSGVDLDDFFAHSLYTTDPLEFESLLAEFGVGYYTRARASLTETGGSAKADNETLKTDLGVRLEPGEARAVLANVFTAGPAQQAGLSANDELVAINGIRVDANNFENMLKRFQPGQTIEIMAFRRDELMRFEVCVGESAPDTCYLELVDEEKCWF